jgi:hypothetical protein
MKDEMELVQEMENVEQRDSHSYVTRLNDVLEAKQRAILALRQQLKTFQTYRN